MSADIPAAIIFVRKRKDFRKEDQLLSDKDSHETYTEYIKFADSKVEEKKLLLDFSCDVAPRKDIAIGPDPVLSYTVGLQTKPIEFTDEEKTTIENSTQMKQFINNRGDSVLSTIKKNQLIDMYTDDLSRFPAEDNPLGGRGGKTLHVLTTLEHFQHTKTKTISCLEFMPVTFGKKHYDRERLGLIVSCLIDSRPFDQRVPSQAFFTRSFALIWNHPDPSPLIALEAPSEITIVRFHPIRTNLIIGGCSNGQVVLWNISEAIEQLKEQGVKFVDYVAVDTKAQKEKKTTDKAKQSQQQQQQSQGGSGGTALLAAIAQLSAGNFNFNMRESGEPDEGLPASTTISSDLQDQNEKTNLIFVAPHRISSLEPGKIKDFTLEPGHRRRIEDMRWIDASKFVTVSGDGRIKTWEMYQTGKMLSLFLTSDTPPAVNFLPFHSITAHHFDHRDKKRPDTQLVTLAQLLQLNKQTDYPTLPTDVWFPLNTEDTFSADAMTMSTLTQVLPIGGSQLLVGTDHGEMVKGNVFSNMGKGEKGEDGGKTVKFGEEVTDVVKVDTFPVTVLQRHPLMEGITLACTGSAFSVWKDGIQTPLLTTPPGSANITTARWSPTRSSVIFLSRSDGNLEVWSLVEKANEPVLVHSFAPHSISSISISPPIPGTDNKEGQYMAVGDTQGRITLMELPRSLCAPSNSERRLFDLFVEHEAERVLSSIEKEEEMVELIKQLQYASAKNMFEKQQKEKDVVKERDAKGEFVYTQDDELVWQFFGTMETQLEPQPMAIDFFGDFSQLEEKLGLKEDEDAQ
ncbi:putative flagellar inner dynein arm I1 intermediate chain IC140 [Blattamonas nauphoetae]|uniref:Flagellar inner dynein arm I1 intermediate chain IC140 n=1 Tax=Blattamonas nauphoetae TaxID=2049346 RepID=A0ABQ9YC96_9EUKA|nr:putative flagellar inner dynein arm I1 intermediate chain IC140 [Blattamonas nauphoetae]